MEPTNEEMAQDFERAAKKAEQAADKLQQMTDSGAVILGLGMRVETALREQRELAQRLYDIAEDVRSLSS